MNKNEKLALMKNRLNSLEKSVKCIKSGSGVAKALKREIRNLETR